MFYTYEDLAPLADALNDAKHAADVATALASNLWDAAHAGASDDERADHAAEMRIYAEAAIRDLTELLRAADAVAAPRDN